MKSSPSMRAGASALLLSAAVLALLIQFATDKTAESARINEAAGAPGPDSIRMQLVKGSDHASVTIIEYTDFLCPPCQAATRILDQVLRAYPDEIQVVFKHYPSSGQPEELLAHEASLAAAAQGKFWPMHDRLMIHRGQATQEDLVRYATELGLDLDLFSQALSDRRFQNQILHETAEARGFGVTRAPTFFINGKKLVGPRPFTAFKQVIDGELGIGQAARGDSPEDPDQRAAIAIGKAPVRGRAEAPITIIEYSDFQCPFCARVTPTVNQLMTQYDGKIRWAFKHFPLPIHPDAPLAHQVALAAGEQGKFWEMHDLIFANQRNLKRDDLLNHAKGLGLDVARIEKDVESGKFESLINSDLEEGQRMGVRATPTFFINGRRVVGALPIEAFKQVIDEELSASGRRGP